MGVVGVVVLKGRGVMGAGEVGSDDELGGGGGVQADPGTRGPI
jgi:hypothetical protein